MIDRLQGEQVITAYLESDPADSDAPGAAAHKNAGPDEGRIVDAIRTSLASAERYDLKIIDPKQFVGHLKGQFPELAREIEDLGPEMDAVVPRYISISGILPDSALSRIKAISGIESAESSKDRYAHVVGAFRALRWMAKLLCGGLFIALLTGLIHLARTNSFLHRESLTLLRLWGASEATLKAPAILSALSVGALGGGLACLSWIVGGGWLAHEIRALSPMLREMPSSGSGTVVIAPHPFPGGLVHGHGRRAAWRGIDSGGLPRHARCGDRAYSAREGRSGSGGGKGVKFSRLAPLALGLAFANLAQAATAHRDSALADHLSTLRNQVLRLEHELYEGISTRKAAQSNMKKNPRPPRASEA